MRYKRDIDFHNEHGDVAWVYVVGPAEERPVKIGHCGGNLVTRLAGIQNGCWHELRVLRRYPMPSKKRAYGAEKSIHKQLERAGVKRLSGEWFDVTASDADAIAQTYLRHREKIAKISEGWSDGKREFYGIMGGPTR